MNLFLFSACNYGYIFTFFFFFFFLFAVCEFHICLAILQLVIIEIIIGFITASDVDKRACFILADLQVPFDSLSPLI